MPSFEELLAARRNAKPKTVKVPVLLDVYASEEIAALEAELEAAENAEDQRLGVPDVTDEIRERLDAAKAASADAVIELEFERLPGDMWTDLTARHPARADSVIDLTYGYNLDAVVKAAAKAERGGHSFAWRLDAGKPAALTAEQWDELFGVLSGHDVSAIRDAVWSINEWEPTQRLAAAKKALAGAETGLN
jgi:hypothetical protein